MVDKDEAKRAAILGPGYKEIQVWMEGAADCRRLTKQASSFSKQKATSEVEIVDVDSPPVKKQKIQHYSRISAMKKMI